MTEKIVLRILYLIYTIQNSLSTIVDNHKLYTYYNYMAEAKSSKIPKLKNLNLGAKKGAIIIIAFAALAILAGYFFIQYQKSQSLLKNPSQASVVEAKQLVDQVGKLIELPATENPTVATVSDSTKLTDQPFFSKAVNGDKVLLYSQSKMLILFRPSLNKIITVGTVNVAPSITQNSSGSQATSPNPSPTQAPNLKSATATVLNGTPTSGLAKKASESIQSSNPNITVVKTGDAVASNNYPSTLVIDVSGSNKDAVVQLAKLLGGKVQSSVPDGEAKPTTDILIILGSDFK